MAFEIPDIDLSGKAALITGANSGIGYETTLGLAKTNCTVIMACRNLSRGQAAMEQIQAAHPEAKLKLMQLDLSALNEVRRFAAEFRENFSKLDILINNAGMLDYSGKKTKDGMSLVFVTNYLGHFLLTSLLLDIIPDSAESRIISLSSVAHRKGEIMFDDIHGRTPDSARRQYRQSKLACLMFADELDRRLKAEGKSTRSLAVHPGGSDTGIFLGGPKWKYRLLKLIAPLIAHSNKEAAKPTLYAALGLDIQGGEYFGPQGFRDYKGPVGIANRSEYSKDAKIASKLWKLSEEMCSRS